MEVGEVPKGIRWSAEAGGPPKVRICGVSGRGQGPTPPICIHCDSQSDIGRAQSSMYNDKSRYIHRRHNM